MLRSNRTRSRSPLSLKNHGREKKTRLSVAVSHRFFWSASSCGCSHLCLRQLRKYIQSGGGGGDTYDSLGGWHPASIACERWQVLFYENSVPRLLIFYLFIFSTDALFAFFTLKTAGETRIKTQCDFFLFLHVALRRETGVLSTATFQIGNIISPRQRQSVSIESRRTNISLEMIFKTGGVGEETIRRRDLSVDPSPGIITSEKPRHQEKQFVVVAWLNM